MNFQKSVLLIATILLIIFLILVGIVLVNSKNSKTWPPLIGECPDYWIDTSGNGAKCENVYSLGKSGTPSPMDFSVAPYIGTRGLCKKYEWAMTNNISWDGITYSVNNPCDVSGNQ